MVFIPHTHTAHPTARSKALAERLRATIADFQMREPKVSAEEIAMALRDAQPRAAGTPRAEVVAVVAVVAAIGAALLAGGMVLLTQRAERAGQEPPTVAITAVVVALLAAVAMIVVRVRNNG